MTVVAWDGASLAADKMCSFGGLHARVTKVYRMGDGSLLAGCGITAQIAEMRQWVAAGCDPAAFPATQRDADKCASVLVVRPDGRVEQYENTPYPIAIENGCWAIGSGRDFAMMAMHLGKSAAEAVELTAALCHDCGNGVDCLRLTSSSEAGASA